MTPHASLCYVEEIRQGKTEAFRQVFMSYYPRLVRYAGRFIDNSEEIDDILQECFVRLWERRHTLNTMSLSAFLFTMVRNECINYVRHQVVVNNFQAHYLRQLSGMEALYHLDFMNNSEQEILYKDLVAHVNRIMETLPKRTQEIFALSRFEGLKNKEIAGRLDISVKVVERHIRRALKVFRAQLLKDHISPLSLLALFWLEIY